MSVFSEYKEISNLLKQKQQVVFYAESRHYLQYFIPLLSDLLGKKIQVCYITSDPLDKLLKSPPGGLKVVYSKWMLGFLFSRLQADVMIMTMPDLGNFLYKRSPGVGTYIYMFHAAVSTHQQYRRDAFKNYDCIFCAGEYQQHEIRKAEDLYAFPVKELIPYGYPLFEELEKTDPNNVANPVVLVAPSWFTGCIFETCIEELLRQLGTLPYTIILRSHPEYEKRKKRSFKRIQKLVKNYPNMFIDDLPDVKERLSKTDLLITDRSGIAFEFAIGTGRPVIFIETILKETNKDWRELNIQPLENSIRSELGVILQTSELGNLKSKLKEAESLRAGFAAKMRYLKEKHFFYYPVAYQKGLDYVLSKINTD